MDDSDRRILRAILTIEIFVLIIVGVATLRYIWQEKESWKLVSQVLRKKLRTLAKRCRQIFRESIFSANSTKTKDVFQSSTREKLPYRTAPSEQSSASLPIDDVYITRSLDKIDNSITDHVLNYLIRADFDSKEYQDYLSSHSAQASWKRILAGGSNMLGMRTGRVPAMRALLAYHVYSCLMDWSLMGRRRDQDLEFEAGGALGLDHSAESHREFCSKVSRSTKEREDLVDTVAMHIRHKIDLHTTQDLLFNDFRNRSLRKIAEAVVGLGIELAQQPDAFTFAFRNKDFGDLDRRANAIKVLDLVGIDEDTMEIDTELWNEEMGSLEPDTWRVRALLSPGISRISHGGAPQAIRKMKLLVSVI